MHAFSDWLALHDFDQGTLQDIVFLLQSGTLFGNPSWPAQQPFAGTRAQLVPLGQKECFKTLVMPAFEAVLPDNDCLTGLLRRAEFQEISRNDGTPPHTVDCGSEAPVLIALNWTGSPDDLVCLAHETAHALQALLSRHEPMPPVAREACAFLGELFLIAYAAEEAPDLYPALCDVWHRENKAYFGRDVAELAAALASPGRAYHYRHNYPVARLAAVELFFRGRGDWLQEVFAAGNKGMRYLPVEDMANRAGNIENYLPPLPETDSAQPAVDAYRSLGAMALIDIDHWQGKAQKRIDHYYSGLLGHLRDRTAFIALNEQRKPIGYATWARTHPGNRIMLTHQAAPFGDHLFLQRALEQHLGPQVSASAHHEHSARPEQVAW